MIANQLLQDKESTDPEAGLIIEAILNSIQPSKILEIGACRGEGAEVWIKILSKWGGKYVGIEPSKGNLEILIPKLSTYEKVVIFQGHSQNSQAKWTTPITKEIVLKKLSPSP